MTIPTLHAPGAVPIVRFRLRHLAGESLWLVPAFYVVVALLLVGVTELLPTIDLISGPEVDATLLTSVASGTLALAGFVITISFITVEFASIAMSPRLVGILRRDRQLKRALGLSFGAFVYSTIGALLVRDDEQSVDDVFGIVATSWSILAAIWFVVMLDRVTNTLRVGNAVAVVGDQARRELEIVHPLPFGAAPDGSGVDSVAPEGAPRPADASPDATSIAIVETAEPARWDGDFDAPPTQRFLVDGPGVLAHDGRPGTLVAIDAARLAALARERDSQVRLLVPIGRFVPAGSALLRVDGETDADWPESLRPTLAFASEPTLAHDPRHAFRVLVDIGLKGLAPGVNDPTTAVQAIDQMHDLLRRLAWRQLG
ncbi:MAG: DUF2254 family protein, partial [Solirubrobacteraceae bacterium]